MDKEIIEARKVLRDRSPFLDFVLEKIELRPVSAVPGARVYFSAPHFVLEYNRQFFKSLPPSQRAAVLEHEIRHILHHHMERRETRDPMTWNIACDLAINAHIRDLPPGALKPNRSYRGREAEKIYDRIAGKNPYESDGFCQASLVEGSPDLIRGFVKWLHSEAANRFDKFQILKELARFRGDMPGGIEEHVVPSGSLNLNWSEILRHYSKRQFKSRTLCRPDRRGLSIWGKQRDHQSRVVLAVDTSGSISATEGAVYFAELNRLRTLCLSLHVILADAKVQSVKSIEELGENNFIGRGGTSFAPAIDYVNSNFSNHDLFIYLTDGFGEVPAIKPSIPMVWVVTENKEFEGEPQVFAGANS